MPYVKIDPPKKKADWAGKLLLLGEVPSSWSGPIERWLPEAGAVLRITRRLNAKETSGTCDDCSALGDMRILKVSYQCPHCRARQICFVPEKWVAEGIVSFVEVLK